MRADRGGPTTELGPRGEQHDAALLPAVGPDDVAAAARGLIGRVHRTPVLTYRRLDAELGCQVLLKAENLQRAGAFKVRGAMWALDALSPGQGVVAYSSGNHAQAVALAARERGTTAVIVMPRDAPRAKIEATRSYGADIVFYDRRTEDRREIADGIARERGHAVIPPFDHPRIIAGQGTAARELFEDAGELDALYVPCGGGGLLTGSVLAAEDLSPACEVIGVEPTIGDDAAQSLAAGHPVTIAVPDTIADGAQTTRIGDLPFRILSERGIRITDVGDEDLVAEMRSLAAGLKVVVEPTGALGIA
ncbi:MAG: pyridoxal-phosphate dependent enzyme, partial [Brachybacterium sp.]|nr:pyridoxal-phosphate dependent enzyme [Brachybacterium sp.]